MKFQKLLVGALSMAMASSVAAAWPEKPITLIVPYKAGGTTYSMSR